MTVLLHFNELSIQPANSRSTAESTAAKFVAVILEMKRHRADLALLSSVSIPEVQLFDQLVLAEWGKRPANRDGWRSVRGLQNRSPGWHRDPTDASNEYLFDGKAATGIANAHISEGLVISLDTSPEWSISWLESERRSLVEHADGDVEISSELVQVRNASEEAHLTDHLDWASLAGMSDVESGRALANNCAEMFPSLVFLPRALTQLTEMQSAWVGPVAQQLALLNRALVEWKGTTPAPTWFTHVTPDSQSRRDSGILDFSDLDGVVRTFGMHARFTPGAGRIHFRVLADSRSAVIAHVGTKIQ